MKTTFVSLVSLFGALAAGGISAATESAAQRASPDADPPDSSVIRITGDDYAAGVVAAWTAGFHRDHAGFEIRASLQGTGTGLAGLYTHQSDLAVMGRALTSVEHDAYGFATDKNEAFAVEVMTGGLDREGKSAALAVFVREDNPLDRLTLAQLDGIIGTEHRRGPANLRTWGDVGSAGEWKDRPIRVYLYDQKTGPGAFLDHVVTLDSSKWNWGPVKEFKDIAWNADGYRVSAGRQIVDALSLDPGGLGIATLRFQKPGLKVVALAAETGSPSSRPTAETLVSRQYPLTRPITIYANRRPHQPLAPGVHEFLRYVLSPEGQAAIAPDSGFLPLSSPAAEQQRKKLD